MGPAGQHETVVVIVVDQTGPVPSFLIVEGGEHVKPNGRDVENVSAFQAHAAATPGCSFSSNTHRSALQAALAPAGGAAFAGGAGAAGAAGAAVPANPTEALIDRIVTSIANSRSPSTKHKITCAALVAIISSDPATAAAALATLIANLTSAAALAAGALAAGALAAGGAGAPFAAGGAGAAEHTVLLLAEEAFAQGRGDDAIATLVSAASAVHGGDLIKQSVVAAATACYRVKFVDGTDDNSRRGTQAGREALVEYDRLVALGMPPNDAAMATRLGRILCPRAVATYGCVKGEAVAGRPYYVEAERELFEEIGLDVRGAGALIAVTPTVFLLEGGPYHAQIDTVLTARCGRGPGLGAGGAVAGAAGGAGGAGAVPIREGEVLSWEWMTGPTLSSSLNADTLSAFRALLNVFGINGIRRSLSKSPVPELATMFATATATPAAAGGAGGAGGAAGGAGGAAGGAGASATPPSAAKAGATYVPPHLRAGGAGGAGAATPPSAAQAGATPPSAAQAGATYVPPHMRVGGAGGGGGGGAGGRQAQGPRYGTGFGGSVGSGGSGGSGSAKWGKPGPGPRRNSRSRTHRTNRTNRTNRTHSTRRKSRRNRTYRR
jgi:hypothetical protein